MKKTMKTLLALMAGVMTFSACSNEDVLINETPNVKPEVEGIRTFTAFTESDPATRATIDGLSVKWQSGDAISVVVDADVYDKYNLTAGDGTTSGTFVANGDGVSGSDIYAVYPYRADEEHYVTPDEAYGIASSYGITSVVLDKIKNGNALSGQINSFINSGAAGDPVIDAYMNDTPIRMPAYTPQSDNSLSGFVIPSTQEVSGEEVVDPKAVVMVAKADDVDNLAFKNVCAYIKVTPTVELKKIVVSANDGEDIAGTFAIDMSEPATPTAKSVDDGSSEVTLQAEEGNLAADKTYYIAVLPGTLAGGLSIKFYTDNSNYTENSINTPFTFERNKVYNGGSQPAADAAQWTMYTTYQDWINPNYSRYMTSLYIRTGQSAPDGEDATVVYLNGEHTLWSRYDAGTTTAYIETNKSVIVATSLSETFRSFTRLTSISGLDKIDVSNVSDFGSCFRAARFTSLDLSQWQIQNGAYTNQMFNNMAGLEELRINNTFPAGAGMFAYAGQYDYMGGPCQVYGASDDLKSADDTTDRDADRMVWAD